jgi:MFS family permease
MTMGGRLTRITALAALLVAVAIAFADSSIVVIALPDVLRQFDTSITGAAWVVTAYNLVLALASLALVVLRRRTRPERLLVTGVVLFLGSSIAAGAAPRFWVLVSARSLQGLGAALLLAGSLAAMRALAPARGAALWAGAGLFGAALGPAAGGLLTELFSWRAIFYAQAPAAALALLAARSGPEPVPETAAPRGRRLAANAGLAFVSAALVGLLFLAVVLLIDVWRLSPLAAAAVVSVIPLATLAAQPLARRAGPGTGVLLLAGGLTAMGLLPARSVVWAALSLAIAGTGLGLVVPGLSRIALAGGGAAGASTTWARHAGLVLGLLVLTPLLSSDLAAAGDRAKLRATAAVLDSQLPATEKLELAFDLAPVLAHPPRKGLPSFEHTLAGRPPEEAALGGRLDSIVEAGVTRGFRTSFLVAALLALAALVPVVLAAAAPARRVAALAVAACVALLGAEFARGALDYGARPRILPACAVRASFPGSGADPAAQRLVLHGLDLVACRVGKSRERLVVDLAGAGVDAADFADRLDAYAKRLVTLPSWLRNLLGG